MNFFSFVIHPPKPDETISEDHLLADLETPEHHITDGGEFLDDALRMVEQPFKHTEESVAAGNPREFF